jgi:hypothetical protein
LDQPEAAVAIDESIAQLGEKLQEWFYSNVATFASDDRQAQANALLRGFELVREFDRLKADGLAAITGLLTCQDVTTEEQRAASLIRGFEFGARLANTLHDEIRDIADGETKVVHLMDEIVKALDTIGAGREALAGLLDHPEPGVRSSAGAYLIDLMPQRVIPILRQIEEKRDASSASFRAHWILLNWEREGKSRFNYLMAGPAQAQRDAG